MAQTLAELNAKYNRSTTAKGTTMSSLPAIKNTYNNSSSGLVAESDGQNNGGLFGGIGYVGEKFGLGVVSSLEGVWDFTAGGLAKLFGADDWAEEQFANDWINYNHADEWYNPSDGWRFAGDVAGGIGTSALPMAAAAIPGVGTALSLALTFTSAAGNATKEAYRQTGELGLKEFGYGAMVGATEAVVEKLTMGLNVGTGRLLNTFSKEGVKGVSNILAKLSAKSVVKDLTVDFLSEGLEEAIAEAVAPLYQRITYDKNAEFASPRDILYAAFVGGVSGLVMSGLDTGITSGANYRSGNLAVQEGRADNIIKISKAIAERENEVKGGTGIKAFEAVKETYGELEASFKETGGQVKTARQKMLLGALNRANLASTLDPFIERCAIDNVLNAEKVAEVCQGVKDSEGNPFDVTAKEIREGIDVELLTSDKAADRRKGRKQIHEALAKNQKLTLLSVTQATGHILMDAQKFSEAAKSGAARVTDANLNMFKTQASQSEQLAFARDLGYTSLEEFYRASNEDVRARIEEYLFKNGSEIMKQRRIKLAETTYGKENALRHNAQSGVDNSSVETGNDNARLALTESPQIVIEKNSELAERIEKSNKSKYKVIMEYLIEKFGGQEFVLSDGRKAIMDNRDAKKLSSMANDARIAQLGNLRKLVEEAQYSHSETEVEHRKFTAFHYYAIDVVYRKNKFKLWLNVGVAKNDGINHIYDITNRKEEVPTKNGVSRPVGNAIQSTSSNGTSQLINTSKGPNVTPKSGSVVVPNNNIPQNTENSNSSEKNSSERKENALRHNAQSGVDNSSVEAQNVVDYEDQSDNSERFSLSKTKTDALKEKIVKLGAKRIKLNAGGKQITVLTDEFTVNKAIFSQSGRTSNEVNARIKAIDDFDKILLNSEYVGTETDIRGIEKAAKKGVKGIHRFKGEYGNYETEAVIRDKGEKQYLYEIKFIKKKGSQQSMTDESASTAPNGDVENTNIVPQTTENSNTSEKNSLENTADAGESRLEAVSIGVWAKQNVESYGKLSEPSRRAVEDTIRQARAFGFDDAEIRIVANFAAHSGLRVVYDEQLAKGGDGRYNGSNTVYIDPNAPKERRYSRLLLHEGGHALIRQKGFRKLIAKATELVSPEKAKEIRDKYTAYYEAQEMPKSEYEPIIEEEIAMAAIEDVLGVDGAWDYILAQEKTFGEKLLDFFRGAARDYAEVSELSKEARKLLNQYKKLFNEFSERNRGNNAFEDNVIGGERFAIKYPTFSEDDISKNIDEIADMDAVAIIDASRLEKTGKKPMDTFNEYFNSLGNNIASEIFGDIALPKSSAKSEIRHGITAEKIASIEAIPVVIEQGKVIFHKNKEAGVERIVVCAPIKIGHADYYMGVMLQRDARYQRLYLHNVVSVAIEREATSFPKDNLVTTGALENDNHLSITSIIQKALNVKINKQKNRISQDSKKSTPSTKKDTGERLALPLASDKVEVSRGELSKEARKLLNQYKKLFNEFSERNRGNNAFEDSARGGGRYALSKNAKRDIKNALNDKNYAGEVKLTDSSPSILLTQKGVRNLPMIMNASHLRENIFTEAEAISKGLRVNKNIHYHGLGEDLFIKVIDELDSVTEAYRGTKNAEKSERRENYFLLISQHSDKDGNVINIPVYINEKGLYNRVFIDTNKISTVFGRIGLRKHIKEQIEKGNLVKIKARSTQNSESTSLIKADFEMNASVNSISQNFEKSTPSTKKDTGERLAISNKLSDDLDSVLKGTFDASKNEVYIGTTSNFMTNVIGAEGLDLYMPAAKAYSALVTEEEYNKKPYYSKQDNYHGIGKEKLIEILEKSENPIVAFASAPDDKGNKRQNRIVLVTDEIIKDTQTGKDGYAVVVEEVDTNALHSGKRVKANKAITVYPRSQMIFDIQSAIVDGRILDITKKGEHLFAGVRGSNPQAAIQKDVLKKNIADFWANVKWLKEKNKKTSSSQPKTITPMQAALQKSGYIDQHGHIQYTQDSKKDTPSTKNDNRERLALPLASDKVEVSRGKLAQIRADFQGERRFIKKDILVALGDIDALSGISKKAREDIADRLWKGYNERVDQQGYDKYSAVMRDKLYDEIFEKYGREMDDDALDDLKVQIDGALKRIVAEARVSQKARLLEQAAKESDVNYWKREYKELEGRDKLLGNLMAKAQKMKELKLGAFANATQHKSEIFKGSIESLSKINFRGNLNITGTRRIIADLKEWYTKDNPVLGYIEDQSKGYYDEGVAEMLDILSAGEKGFTKQDLKMLLDVMSYFTNLVETYNKVWRQGKWQSAPDLAEGYIDILRKNEKVKIGAVWNRGIRQYIEMFGDPMSVARRMDMYEDGFFTSMLSDLRDAAVDAAVTEMEVRAAYDEFMSRKENKNYVERTSREKVFYRDAEIPKMHLIGLYLTMKRSHAQEGIIYNGFTYKYADETVRIRGFVDPSETRLNKKQIAAMIKEQLGEIEKQFNAADKEYISILEKGYNVDVKKLKVDRDIQRLGFTNANEDYYYPIRRADIARNIDVDDVAREIDRVTNSSFNKDTVKGAKQKLFIEPADALFNRHVHAVCQYACLSPAIETFNTLFNLDVSGNRNDPISIRTESQNTWKDSQKYFSKLISDIQGIPVIATEGSATFAAIRGAYAKYQLGANPKVWLTQISSIFASSSFLDADSIARGFATGAKDIDEYCGLAKLRNYDNTAAMAQGNLESRTRRVRKKIDKFTDALMVPIGKVDRFVVSRLFGACQAQIEKDGGAKIGTEENKTEAGKLLKKVLLETQQNSLATERSRAMRSGSEFMRTITMFTSDSMKVFGRVVDSVGEVTILQKKMKTESDEKIRAELKKRLKIASKNARKSIGALVSTAAFMMGIAQLFRWLYNKEQDEDESIAETMATDFVGNLFGGLPLIKDIYSFMVDGFELENYTYSSINDLLSSVKSVVEAAGAIISGEASSQDIALSTRKLMYAVGQFTGVPIRNVYNVFYGLTKRFSPTTAYKIDNVFYEKNYKTDLYKAIENEDGEMAAMLLSLLYGERMGGPLTETVYNELYALSMKGYKVLPKAVGDSFTYNGEEYELDVDAQTILRSTYATSQSALEKLFANSNYKGLTDEQKVDAIDYVHNLYYDSALEHVTGIGQGNAVLVGKAISADKLALLYVTTKGLESDKDKSGKTVTGNKRAKVVAAIKALDISTEEKLLLICAKGYAIKDGDIRGLSAEAAKRRLLKYILSLSSLTKEEKATLAELCGFEVKNGRIVQSSVA